MNLNKHTVWKQIDFSLKLFTLELFDNKLKLI